MRIFWKIVAILLLAAWLPASSHCALENAGVFAETCCIESEPDVDHGGPDHANCLSCQFESGGVMIVKQTIDLPLGQPVDLFEVLISSLFDSAVQPNEKPGIPLDESSLAPPSQHLLLKATPIRGPSFHT